MALASRKVIDTINWAKRQMENKNPVIGNSLDPALTAANHVMQTILAPPFDWWWNNEEVVFTCNPTANTATASTSTVTSGVLTVTAANTFAAGNMVLAGAYTGSLAYLAGQIIEIVTATSSQFTANVQGANGTDTTHTVFTNVTTQDYTVPLANFSHIEHASVFDLQTNPGTPVTYTPVKWRELTVKNNLSLESSQNRPMFIGPHVEDVNGNMTFRVFPSPDKPYPIEIHAQLAPPIITSINQTWAPIPDFMSKIYDMGFLALMYLFTDNPQGWQLANVQFKAAILGRAEALTEEERNIFLNNWENLTQVDAMKKQQGIAARGQ